MNPADQEKWHRIVELMRRGRRRDAKALAEELAQSLASYPAEWRERWVEACCKERIDAKEVSLSTRPPEFSFPLLRDVVFPVLRGRLEREDADAARWLAWLVKEYSGAGKLWDELPESSRTPAALLRQAERWRPDDVRILAPLVDETIRWFDHAMHELPAGVLYGMDGASADECRQMRDELRLLEERLVKLGRLPRYAVALAFWRRIVDLYATYREETAVAGFEAYLSEHFPEWRAAISKAAAATAPSDASPVNAPDRREP